MALIKCPDCEKEVSQSAPSCPSCGAPIADWVEPPKKGDVIPYTDQEVAVMLSKRKKTSHLLHFFLSIFTLGFWVIIWLLVGISNALENRQIDTRIAKGKKLR